jgi:hypothetical protein
MAYMDSKRLRTEDPASARMFAETLKAKPIRFAWKPEAAAGHSAELVEKAIVALQPLTEPRKATPCENATAVAKLLHDGVRKLRSLQPVAPLPSVPPLPLPNSPKTPQGRHDLEYVGVGWSPEKVQALRRRCDKDLEVPHALIKEFVLDSVAADRQFALARSYLGALFDASRVDGVDGVITFSDKEYTSQQLYSAMPKLRGLHLRRRAASVKTATYVFQREGSKTAKKILRYRVWAASGGLRQRAAAACVRRTNVKKNEIRGMDGVFKLLSTSWKKKRRRVAASDMTSADKLVAERESDGFVKHSQIVHISRTPQQGLVLSCMRGCGCGCVCVYARANGHVCC